MAPERKRHPARGGAVQLGGEQREPTQNPPKTQGETRPYRVIVSRGLWRGCDVSIDPPICTHPLRTFPDHGAAMAHAEAVAKLENWPFIDRAGGAE